MTVQGFGGAALFVALVALPSLALRPQDTEAIGETPPVPAAKTVVVELFTSQGCSSCPPADRLLSELSEREPSIIALAFHVDYWNYIGWTDPFSSSAWSERQRRYGTALGADRIYTPQIIVNGRRHAVGSDWREVTRLIEEATAVPALATLDVSVTRLGGQQLSVRMSAAFEQHPAVERLSAWLAIVEDGLETPVTRGENAHRTLENNRVVRQLLAAGTFDARSGSLSGHIELDLDPAWTEENLSLTAFLQDDETLGVHAAATAVIPARL